MTKFGLIISLLGFFAASPVLAEETTHICYFSFNNDQELVVMKDFVKQLNEVSPRKISVAEYQVRGSKPETSFKKMVESGVKCDGLVISGHHTGSWGGKLGRGNLNIDFLEKLSCDPKYADWFDNVKALWLQGCRTLGEKISPTNSNAADFHTLRVGAARGEDDLSQSIARLNIEFSATLDRDNPLSSRYMRVFPKTTVFGWTASAPGPKVHSELSIPYHMAHIASLNEDNEQYFAAPNKQLDSESAAKYAESILNLLNRNVSVDDSNCAEQESIAIEAWLDHGKLYGKAPYTFNNPFVSAFPSLVSSDNTTLASAREINCILKKTKNTEELKELVDRILSDEDLIGYSFQNLWEVSLRLKKQGEFAKLAVIEDRLRKSEKLNNFLMRKLSSKEVGILRMIDYYVYYRDLTNQPIPAIENKIRNNYLTLVKSRLQNPEGLSHDEIDFFNTNLQSILKQNITTVDFQKKLDEIYLSAIRNEVSGIITISGFAVNSEDSQIAEALAKAQESDNPKVRKAAASALLKINKK